MTKAFNVSNFIAVYRQNIQYLATQQDQTIASCHSSVTSSVAKTELQ